MQLTKFLWVGLAAASVVKRDFATFQTAFGNVGTALNTLDQSVLALTATSDVPAAVSDLTSKSGAVVDALNTGAASINATSALSLVDSVNLLSLSNTLVASANTTVNDLIGKKSIIDAAGQDALVVTQLQGIKAATQGFIAGVVSKVPSSVQSLAQQQAGQVITVINNGITAFGGSVSKRMAAML